MSQAKFNVRLKHEQFLRNPNAFSDEQWNLLLQKINDNWFVYDLEMHDYIKGYSIWMVILRDQRKTIVQG